MVSTPKKKPFKIKPPDLVTEYIPPLTAEICRAHVFSTWFSTPPFVAEDADGL